MAPKLELDKLAWQWIETTLPESVNNSHVETAYRLNVKKCKLGSCRRNCKGNPHCFEGLGEKEWLGDVDESSWVELDDPLNERRIESSFVGLKNLGATCYVNSLLQLWFHNAAFRQAVYHYNPDLESHEDSMTDSPVENEIDYYPKSVIGQLQLVFALLQFSNRRYIDPSGFIRRLGLNTAEQQDAQEFSKLFISLLEDKLKCQRNKKVSNVIQHQFRGDYEYCTKCSNCSVESTCPSGFYELDLNIKGNKDLYECIEEFLKEERLEGNDKYYCSSCNSKQDAIRKIQLKRLPVVLNFQLLRFIYDRHLAQKKKLNTCIKFPEELDMSRFLTLNDVLATYDLTAVLIHRGSSAYSGHYIALIKDRNSGFWYKFNDETIEKIDEKSLKSGIEDDSDSGQSKPLKLGRTPKGFYSSTNAYMLVYQRRNVDSEVAHGDLSVEWDLPEKLQEAVMKDNSKFEEWVTEMNQMREQNVMFSRERQLEIREFYNELKVEKSNEDYEWIPTGWLIKWMSCEQHVPPIDNFHDLCPHRRLHPNALVNSKYIKKKIADKLFKKYGGGPRFGKEVHCRSCVVSECRLLRWRLQIQEDFKFITSQLKLKIPCEQTTFWVGKASLRCWRKLALQQMLDNVGDFSDGVSSSLDSCRELDERSSQDSGGVSYNENDAGDVDDYPLNCFNDDLLCEHGQLKVEESSRRLVLPAVWQKLKFYFPSAPEFLGTDPICRDCKAHSTQVLHAKDGHRKLAAEQKLLLQNLYLDKNRPFSSLDVGCTNCYILNNHFLETWRKFIKEPTRRDPISDIKNATLLCEHQALICQPHLEDSANSKLFTLVWESEWKVLKTFFNVDRELIVTINKSENNDVPLSFNYKPEVCIPCYEAVLKEEHQRKLEYDKATIYICRAPSITDIPHLQNSLYDMSEDGTGKEDSDPEFVQGGSAAKKRRMNSRSNSSTNLPVMLNINEAPLSPHVRRSSRHRRGRDEKSFVVSSQQTLRDLKLQIMKHFCVAPFDQHLSIDGRALNDNQATLRELGILPNSVIYLMADEPIEEIITNEVSIPEEGFKGTELVRR